MKIFCLAIAILHVCWCATAAEQAVPDLPVAAEGDRAGRKLSLAEGLMQRGFFDLAEIELNAWLETYPRHGLAPRARLQLATTLQKQQKDEEALNLIRQALAELTEHPLIPRMQILAGDLLIRQEQQNKALDMYQAAAGGATDPVLQETALFFAARLHAELGQVQQAADIYRSLGHKSFENQEYRHRPFALLEYAAILARQEDWEAADQAYARLAESPKAPATLRQEAMLQRGENLFRQKKFDSAIETWLNLSLEFADEALAAEAGKRILWAYHAKAEFHRLVEAAQNWQQQHRNREHPEVNYLLAVGLLELQRFEQALPWLESLSEDAEIRPGLQRQALFHLIYCHLRLARHQQAIALAQQFIERYQAEEEATATVHYFLAVAAFATEQSALTVDHAGTALETAPAEWEFAEKTRMLLADALLARNKPAEAAAIHRERARTASPEQQAQASLTAGTLAEQAGKKEDAVADYRRVLELPKATPETLHTAVVRLARLYTETGRLTEAEELFSAMVEDENTPNRAQLWLLLGYVQREAGKPEQAVASLRRITGLDVDPAIVHEAKFFLAEILLELDHASEALTIFAELIALPEETRPELPGQLLLRLQGIFFRQGDYQTSEAICRQLMRHDSNSIRQVAARQLAETKIARRQLDEAADILTTLRAEIRARETEPDNMVAEGEIQALLGEVFYRKQEFDRAASLLQAALARPDLTEPHTTKSRWLLAKIMHREGRSNQALRHAVNAFVLGNDPVHAPRAMLLSMEILVELERWEEASTTWQEMKSRFPLFADQHREHQAVINILNR